MICIAAGAATFPLIVSRTRLFHIEQRSVTLRTKNE